MIPGAFVAININNAAVTTAMNFAADTANDAMIQSLTIGSETLAPTFNAGVYSYAVTASAASDKVDVTTVQADADVAISYKGKNVKNGGTVTWETGYRAADRNGEEGQRYQSLHYQRDQGLGGVKRDRCGHSEDFTV